MKPATISIKNLRQHRYPIIDAAVAKFRAEIQAADDQRVWDALDKIGYECSICKKDIRRDDVLSDNCPECTIRSVLET
ncbi:MAG: hypothetical protein WC708_01580 [Lentisphaeria bacterium]|jgi:hypothetical protein